MSTLLVSCCAGTFVEVILPEYPQNYTDVSFHLVKSNTKSITFQSCKSQIRRDMNWKEIEEWKLKKLERKKEELDKIKKEDLGIDIDEETFLGIINYICIGKAELSYSASRQDVINVMKVKQVNLDRLANVLICE
jgi:CRISPR/Cas system CMR-associated protein Cmr1 (group 7 of RAMP superfamily)